MSDWESQDRIKLLDEIDSVPKPDVEAKDKSPSNSGDTTDGGLSPDVLKQKAYITMSDLMDDIDGKVRLGAAQDVLDRFGAPRRKNEMGGGGKTVILNFPPSAITDALKGMKEFIDVESPDRKLLPPALPAPTS